MGSREAEMSSLLELCVPVALKLLRGSKNSGKLLRPHNACRRCDAAEKMAIACLSSFKRQPRETTQPKDWSLLLDLTTVASSSERIDFEDPLTPSSPEVF